jgi:peptidoglycan/LPS O-acetylase OafA/YrhL
VPYGIADLVMLPGFLLLIGSLAALDNAGRTPRPLRHRALRQLGTWSFALYLVHQVIVRVTWVRLVDTDLSSWAWVLVSLGVALVSIAGSWLLYRYVEHPCEERIRERVATPPGSEVTAAER